MKKRTQLLFALAFAIMAFTLLFIIVVNAEAEPCPVGKRCVAFAWDANTEPDLAGYRVYTWDAPGIENTHPPEVNGYKISSNYENSISLNNVMYTNTGGSRITLLPPTCRDNTTCDADIESVTFFVNGTQTNVERDYPYDLLSPGATASSEDDRLAEGQVHTIRAVVNLVAGGTVELTAQALWLTMLWEGTATETPTQILPDKRKRIFAATAYDDAGNESVLSDTVCTDCGNMVKNMRIIEVE